MMVNVSVFGLFRWKGRTGCSSEMYFYQNLRPRGRRQMIKRTGPTTHPWGTPK